MCDYSLNAFPNRLAVEGEDLVVHRFAGASLGLASPADLSPAFPSIWGRCADQPGFWTELKAWWKNSSDHRTQPKKTPAVCIPPGATLLLRDIPGHLRRSLSIGEAEEVRFLQTTAEANAYRDAIQFSNKREVLLQALAVGQRVTVLSLGSEAAGSTDNHIPAEVGLVPINR